MNYRTKEDTRKVLRESIQSIVKVETMFVRNPIQAALHECYQGEVLTEGAGRKIVQFVKRATGVTVGAIVGTNLFQLIGGIAGAGIGTVGYVLGSLTTRLYAGGDIPIRPEDALDVAEKVILGTSMTLGVIGGLYGLWVGGRFGYRITDSAESKLFGKILKVTDKRDVAIKSLADDINAIVEREGQLDPAELEKIINANGKRIKSLTDQQKSLANEFDRKFSNTEFGQQEVNQRIVESAKKGLFTTINPKNVR